MLMQTSTRAAASSSSGSRLPPRGEKIFQKIIRGRPFEMKDAAHIATRGHPGWVAMARLVPGPDGGLLGIVNEQMRDFRLRERIACGEVRLLDG